MHADLLYLALAYDGDGFGLVNDLYVRRLGEPLEILFHRRVVCDDIQNLAWLDPVNILPCLEQRLGTILVTFTFIAIFIASLGLVSLVSYITEQSVKEIGIRKTFGASVPNILFLLSRDFLKLVIVSNLVALPVGYYLVDNWLRDFTYRTGLGLPVFLFAGLLTLLFALVAVSYQSVRAARVNPADSLRTE